MDTHQKYTECLRNHAATLGTYATDGCGEFTTPSGRRDDSSPSSLHCAACGCHRNFHRRVTYSTRGGREVAVDLVDYGAGDTSGRLPQPVAEATADRCGKKRLRTKFTAEQKEKMLGFAEKLGWKLQRKDEEDEVERFCRGVGVSRQVFKVWMHNHKNSSCTASTGNASSLTTEQ